MAIAVVNAVSGDQNSVILTQTLAVDCTGGNCLLVFTGWRRNDAQDLSSVTYNGVAMTSVYTDNTGTTLFGGGFSCHRLVAPSSGSHDVVATYTPNALNSAAILAVVLSGVDQTTPISASSTAADSSGASVVTTDVTSAAGKLVVGCGVFRGGTDTTPTIGAGQTNIDTDPGFGAGGDEIALACSYEAGAGTVTFSYSYAPGATNNAAIGAVSLNAAAGGSFIAAISAGYQIRGMR